MGDSAQPLRIETYEIAGHPCLKPIGEVDIASVGTLQEAMASLLEAGHSRLVMDLQGLTYLDSTGLGSIAAARRRAREAGGDMLLICANSRILRLLSITGMDLVFRIVRNAEEAERVLGGESPQ